MWYPFKRQQITLPERSLEDIKNIANILFIDDHEFEVVSILTRAGWQHTRRVRDLESTDQKEVQEAHIIFVDIQGVGKKMRFKEEGLGLIIALKEKYPNKKIIVYSAQSEGDMFHKALSIADARLSKNADPIEFQEVVERFSKEAFSLEECLARVKQLLTKELGYSVQTDEVLKKMEKIYSSKRFDKEYIGKIFNLQNAANLAQIIALFLRPQ